MSLDEMDNFCASTKGKPNFLDTQQIALHGTTLENHPETSVGPENNKMVNYGHVVMPM